MDAPPEPLEDRPGFVDTPRFVGGKDDGRIAGKAKWE